MCGGAVLRSARTARRRVRATHDCSGQGADRQGANRTRPARRLSNVRSCRMSLDRPLVALLWREHPVWMVASASVDQSPELRPAAVAHLSRYRGTSRQHTESDLRVFFEWCRKRQLSHWARSAMTWSSTCGGCRTCGGSSRRRSPAGCPSSPASTEPASSTASLCTHPPTGLDPRTLPSLS